MIYCKDSMLYDIKEVKIYLYAILMLSEVQGNIGTDDSSQFMIWKYQRVIYQELILRKKSYSFQIQFCLFGLSVWRGNKYDQCFFGDQYINANILVKSNFGTIYAFLKIKCLFNIVELP